MHHSAALRKTKLSKSLSLRPTDVHAYKNVIEFEARVMGAGVRGHHITLHGNKYITI